MSELTLEEKVGLISPDPGMGDLCFAHIHAIPRLDVPAYGWLVECNTGAHDDCSLSHAHTTTTVVPPHHMQ